MRGTPVWLLLAVAALSPLSVTIVIPAVPRIAEDLATGYGVVQLLITGYLLGLGVTQLAIGPMADRFGRRVILSLGLALFIIASVACALADSIALLLGARFVQAMAIAVNGAVARAVVRDAFDDRKVARVMGWMTALLEVTAIVATPLGGRLTAAFGWPSMFWLLAAAGGTLLALVSLFLRETRPADTRPSGTLGQIARNYAQLLGNRAFTGNLVVISLGAGAGISLLTVMPGLMSDAFGMGSDRIGDLLAFNGLALAGGALLAGRLSPILGMNRLVTGALAIGSAYAVAWLLWLHAAPVTLFGAFASLLVISAFRAGVFAIGFAAALRADPAVAGTASGLAGATVSILGAAFGALGAAIYEVSFLATVYVVTGCMVVSLAVAIATGRPERRAASTGAA